MMRSPEQQFAMAKGLPIGELAKVLQGQSDVVDMSIAEMVLRQKMQAQRAQQGIAAQPAAQQPKVVERDLAQAQQMSQPAMTQGVAALPADVDVPEFAGGGIVAFQGGGLSRVPTEAEVKAAYERWMASKPSFFMPTPKSNLGTNTAEDEYTRLLQAFQSGQPISGLAPLAAQQAKDTFTASQAPPAATAQTSTQAAPSEAPKADRPPVAIRPAGYDDLFKRAQSIAGQISPAIEPVPTVKEEVAQQRAAMQEAGYDFNLIKDQISQIRQEKEQSKEDRKEAVNLRLLEAGLGILGGESPYAFVNIGKGASPALKGLSEDIKDLKKIDRERDKAMRDLSVAENQVASGMGLAALKARESAQDRIARADEARATRTASIFSTLTSADTQRYVADQSLVASKEGKTEDKEIRYAKQAQDAAIKLVNEGTTKFASAAEKEAEIKRLTAIFYQHLKDVASGKVPTQTDSFAGWGTPRVKQ